MASECSLCGPLGPRAKLRDGVCGRCYAVTVKRETAAYKERARIAQATRRARLGGKATLWVAFRNGEAVGVYSSEAKALPVSSVVRPFKINRLPEPQRKKTR